MQTLEYNKDLIDSFYLQNSLYSTLENLLSSYNLDSVQNIQNKWKYEEFNFNIYADKNAKYFLIRTLIYISKWEKSSLNNESISQISRIREHIKTFIYIPEKELEILVDVLQRLVNEVSANTLKSNPAETSLRTYAKANKIKCYICGSKIDYTGSNHDRKLTLEHLIPSSLGGNKSTENLFVACAICNKAKGNYLSWSEVDLLRYNMMYLDITKDSDRKEFNKITTDEEYDKVIQKKFDEKVNNQLIYIVSNLCNHRCGYCEEEVDSLGIEEVYIIKKEVTLPCNPFNLILVCNNCLNYLEHPSFPILPQKRISNV